MTQSLRVVMTSTSPFSLRSSAVDGRTGTTPGSYRDFKGRKRPGSLGHPIAFPFVRPRCRSLEPRAIGVRHIRSGLRAGRLVAILWSVLLMGVAPPVWAAPNRVQVENSKPGSSDWILSNPATHREIEGYASLTSVNVGETIQLFVSTPAVFPLPFGLYTIDVYRTGWYGGVGARKVLGPVLLPGFQQTEPVPDPANEDLVECAWNPSFELGVPSDWVSGVYLAKLTKLNGGKQSYIMFVVREDARRSKYLFQSSVTTFQAYNPWGAKTSGGRFFYGFGYGCPEGSNLGVRFARKLSFNRPYGFSPDKPLAAYGGGAGEFLSEYQPAWSTGAGCRGTTPQEVGWEYNMVRWLEMEGYDVTYSTNVDTHANPERLAMHRAFLSVGHDEYWSEAMRNNVEKARDNGINLGFFSANTAYWKVDLGPSPSTGALNRTLTKVGDLRWRDLGKPENALIGVMFSSWPVDDDLIIADGAHWVVSDVAGSPNFPGSPIGLQTEDPLRGLVGYEADAAFVPPFPYREGLAVITSSPVHEWSSPGLTGFSNMTVYHQSPPSGGLVFATGSIQWSWGLDSFHNSRVDWRAQQMTRNVLSRLGAVPFRETAAVLVDQAREVAGSVWDSDRNPLTRLALAIEGVAERIDRKLPWPPIPPGDPAVASKVQRLATVLARKVDRIESRLDSLSSRGVISVPAAAKLSNTAEQLRFAAANLSGTTQVSFQVSSLTNLYQDTDPDTQDAASVSPQLVPAGPFCPGQQVDLTASGCVVDEFAECTGPDGHPSLFRNLPVYSLIGRWSNDNGSLDNSAVMGNPFIVGSGTTLLAPSGLGPFFLFLGENDGIYTDNVGAYTVTASWTPLSGCPVVEPPPPPPSTTTTTLPDCQVVGCLSGFACICGPDGGCSCAPE